MHLVPYQHAMSNKVQALLKYRYILHSTVQTMNIKLQIHKHAVEMIMPIAVHRHTVRHSQKIASQHC